MTVRARRKRQAAAGDKPVTKTSPITIVLTLALSLLTWVFFYIWTPSAPLTPRETMVIVGACFGLVLASRKLAPRASQALAKLRTSLRGVRTRGKAVAALVGLGLAASATPPVVLSAVDVSGLSCTPDRFIVRPGEKLRARVWVVSPGAAPLEYSWSTDGGRIDGDGRDVGWSFADVQPGYYMATVRVADGVGQPVACSVRVVVATADGTRGFETARAFLTPGETEDSGFGLYSYLLLSSPPSSPAIRERYLSAISSYLSLIRESEEFLKYFERRELNVIYLPVTRRPEGVVAADWVLEHYDYARSRRMLRALRRDEPVEVGPVLASSLLSLGQVPTVPALQIYQDLSLVPPHIVGAWVHLFINQAAQERFWEAKTIDHLVLKLRGAIGILAESVPDVVEGLKTWISLVR
jgi:hypothetical protein